jgi:hypothetical protein
MNVVESEQVSVLSKRVNFVTGWETVSFLWQVEVSYIKIWLGSRGTNTSVL